jgi:iron complex transport system substrate-binding protein
MRHFARVLLVAAVVFFSCQQVEKQPENIPAGGYQRIVSTSPSFTETLFALGQGDRVVGVTRFCNYPPEAKTRRTVGGYLDPNYEAIAALKPDMVLVLPENENIHKYIGQLGLTYRVINNKTVTDILDEILLIGDLCAAGESADSLRNLIVRRMEYVSQQVAEKSRPKVLLAIGRNVGQGGLEEVYVAGQNTYFNELIEAAGGINAYASAEAAYPMLSAEGILNLDPDIIIDMVPSMTVAQYSVEAIKDEWRTVPGLTANGQTKIFVIDSDYATIPGPRFILLLEELAGLLHPEISWDID